MSIRAAALATAAALLVAGCVSASPGSGVTLAVVLDVDSTGASRAWSGAASGADLAADDLDVDATTVPVADAGERAQAIDTATRNGANPVVAIGVDAARDLADVAALHPSTSFVLVDGTFEGVLESTPANVRTVSFAEHEGAFIMGVAAALACGCQRLGFIGGEEDTRTRRYEAGFVAGARHAVANMPVDVRYLGADGDPLATDSPVLAREVALEMFAGGAGAVFAAAGMSSTGVFAAAAEAGRWALGADVDMYQLLDDATRAHILTSMVKRIDIAVYEAARDFVDGQFTGGDIVADLASGGITWSTAGGYVDAVQAQLEQTRDLVASGAITVPTTP